MPTPNRIRAPIPRSLRRNAAHRPAQSARSRFPDAAPGDAFIVNHPYKGALHPPDFGLVAPAFHDGRLYAWVGVCSHQIDVGSDAALTIAGLPLRRGERVGWSFPPARAEITPRGRYQGVVQGVTPVGIGRHVTVRLGDARIAIFDGRTDATSAGQCKFDIDPNSIQVWPLG